MKKLVVIPTYNEIENISRLVPEIFSNVPDVSILVVDDNSPDRTDQAVEKMMATYPQLFILKRPGKQGLGRAYLAGFRWGLDQKFEVIVEMDADFSHRPMDLVKVFREFPSQDFVVGSRYVSGGQTVNWGFLRKLISRGGGIYSRFILGYPLNDWTGGFNAWKADVLQQIGLENVKSEGYSFQIELKFRALQLGFKCKEVPIVFEDRRVGQSKMSLRIVIEAFYRVWLLRFI